MRQDDRLADELVDDSETLYFRWFNDWIGSDQKIEQNHIPMPNQSVNRSGHGGKCWFVLIPDPAESDEGPNENMRRNRRLCQGIVCLVASRIPTGIEINGRKYTFRVEHDPETYNFQHCEIRIYCDGEHILDKRQLDKRKHTAAKKHYRASMCDCVRIILRPEVSTGTVRTAIR